MTNRVELSITQRLPFADGHKFGAAGSYGEENAARAFPATFPYLLDETLQQDWYPVSSGR